MTSPRLIPIRSVMLAAVDGSPHVGLDRHGALDRVDHAGELHQRPVADQLEDAPAVFCDGGSKIVSR